MNSNIDRRIKSCKIQVTSIYQILQKNPDDWQPFLATARQTMATIDSTPSMIHRSNLSDQLWLIEGLQRLAYHEADSGGIRNIADWCLRHWLKVLSSHSDNVEALRGRYEACSYPETSTSILTGPIGIGQNWLWRAQPCLARIHVEDGSVSSTNSADRISIASSYGEAEYERDINQAATEANACRHTADYVEARGILLPATEYFTRAVEAADLQKVLTGDLLSSVSLRLLLE